MTKPFRFSLESKLDASRAERDECVTAFRAAEDHLAVARRELERREAALGEARRVAALAHDRLSDTRRVEHPRADVDRLAAARSAEAAAATMVTEQHDAVVWAAEKVQIQRRRLEAAESEIEGFERMRRKEEQQWRRELDKAEEARADEAAIEQWNRRHPRRPRSDRRDAQ